MEIRFYNTLTHQLQAFEPLVPPTVRMYTCGPTVYDYGHIGNFRAFLFADLLRRFLRFVGYDVVQVMNITDVGHMTEDQSADGAGQDKMLVGSQRLKEAKKQGRADVDNPDDPRQVADFFTKAFLEDAKLLGLLVAEEYPARMPRATAYVGEMIALIQRLIDAGHAYVGADGAVYYDVQSFPEYGRLSGNTLDAQRVGAGGRITAQQVAAKRSPADFLLWKPDPLHLMRWPSPWGEGYPGWHIECSAMAMTLHGVETLDIHTGGEDNIFPHHECEIAQSCGATGKPFARFWMHTRFLLVEGEKMSKSKGNFHTVRDLLAKGVDPAALRYELLRSHYRQNMNFTLKGIEDADRAVRRLRAFAETHPGADHDATTMGDTDIERRFAESLADDLNISGALGALFSWLNAVSSRGEADAAALRRMDSVLGVLPRRTPSSQLTPGGMTDEQVNARCLALDAARAGKDYAAADAIRAELLAAGVEVHTAKTGTTWRRKMRIEN